MKTSESTLSHRQFRSLLVALGAAATLIAPGAFAAPGELRDPTAPPVLVATTVASASVEYQLSGIWWRGRHGSAVVNGRTVSPGATVDGAEVVVVAADYVQLRLATGAIATLRNAPLVVRRKEIADQHGDLAARE